MCEIGLPRSVWGRPFIRQRYQDMSQQRPWIADQVEGSPEVGVNAIGAYRCTGTSEKCTLGICQGSGFTVPTQEGLIKYLHEFCTAGIIDFPEGWQQGSCTGIEETTTKTNYFIYASDNGTSSLTGA